MKFSTAYYSFRYKDVPDKRGAQSRHYKKFGWRERRDPNASFSTAFYLEQISEDDLHGLDPLVHYNKFGKKNGLKPHPFLHVTSPQNCNVGCIHFGGFTDLPEALGIKQKHVVILEDRAPIHRKNASDFDILRVEFGDVTKAVNQAIKSLIEAGATHIWLCPAAASLGADALNSLLNCNEPLVAPAQMGGHGARTIPALSQSQDLMSFSKKWAKIFSPRVLYTSDSEPSFVLINSNLLQRTGFFSLEFDTFAEAFSGFLKRAENLGVPLAVARHVVAGLGSNLSNDDVQGANSKLISRLDHEVIKARRCDMANQKMIISPRAMLLKKGLLEEMDRIGSEVATNQSVLLEKYKSWQAAVSGNFDGSTPFVIPEKVGAQFKLDCGDHTEAANELSSRLLYDCGQKLGLVVGDKDPFAILSQWQPILKVLAKLIASQNAALVLAGNHNPFNANTKDGYIQRVLAIDELFKDRTRIYLNYDRTEAEAVALYQMSPNHWVLNVRVEILEAAAMLGVLFAFFPLIYVHSILAVLNVELADGLATSKNILLDLHGAVPEELQMNEEHELISGFLEIEEKLVKAANRLIVVTNAMYRHLEEKYNRQLGTVITLPIIPKSVQEAGQDVLDAKPDTELPTLLYAGGAQSWQCLNEVAALMVAGSGKWKYRVLTPDVNEWNSIFTDIGADWSDLSNTIQSVDPSEVPYHMKQADFGVLIRDDVVVNRVACPTKLMEYLAFDLIPILKSEKIGDFDAMGLQYLSAHSVLKDGLPGEAQIKKMRKQNRTVLKTLLAQGMSASKELSGLING